jgi:PHP domain-containing protein
MSEALELHDLAGVIHVHSLYSDGTGTVPEIAQAAAANGLDYVLLTDHDTLDARERGEEGWHGPVLVLVGEEVSPLRENHYLAFGLDRPIDHSGLGPREIVARVNEAGGFGFLSHPFSKGSERFRRGAGGMPWRDLEVDGYAGLELWSFVTDSGERLRGIPDLLRFIVTPGRFVDHPPPANLEAWDRLCARRRCVALGGIDAHQLGVRIANRVPLRLMAYKRSFRYLRTHLLVERPLEGALEPDRDAVYAALRAGRAYIAMDSLAPARGFRFWSEGERPLAMGDEAPAGDGSRTLLVRLPRPARLRLLRDGREISARDGTTALEHRVEGRGVYRVEAYLQSHGRERTWIISNPIYLR